MTNSSRGSHDREPEADWVYELPDLAAARAAMRQLQAFPPVGRVVFGVWRLPAGGDSRWFVRVTGYELTPADRTLLPRVLTKWGHSSDLSVARLEEAGALRMANVKLPARR